DYYCSSFAVNNTLLF
nr:immunoglobulin light chain junction region [Macaca mulatta]MOX16962.1 immunoglobulin light chain junction region [Macaca mulatta]MOX17051.1 immunoglobulin light chain junction region [Macaca mulatta]MOX17168.1 immunoglobulin light chain junction region [Macaca mulatta]MOX17169.1 immunoglobulin light chain junction region [Macaca mulatta]